MYHSHYGNILYMMTSPGRLIYIREVTSTEFKGFVTVIAAIYQYNAIKY